jgi:GTPase SAR1 family protein
MASRVVHAVTALDILTPPLPGLASSNHDRSSSVFVHEPYFKLIVVGAPNSGKSSLIRRFVQDTFSDVYFPTVGSDVYTIPLTRAHALPVEPSSSSHTCKAAFLKLVDVPLAELRGPHTSHHLRGAHGVICVADLTDFESFQALDEWRARISLENLPESPAFFLLLNKKDAAQQVEITPSSTPTLSIPVQTFPKYRQPLTPLQGMSSAAAIQRRHQAAALARVQESVLAARAVTPVPTEAASVDGIDSDSIFTHSSVQVNGTKISVTDPSVSARFEDIISELLQCSDLAAELAERTNSTADREQLHCMLSESTIAMPKALQASASFGAALVLRAKMIDEFCTSAAVKHWAVTSCKQGRSIHDALDASIGLLLQMRGGVVPAPPQHHTSLPVQRNQPALTGEYSLSTLKSTAAQLIAAFQQRMRVALQQTNAPVAVHVELSQVCDDLMVSLQSAQPPSTAEWFEQRFAPVAAEWQSRFAVKLQSM